MGWAALLCAVWQLLLITQVAAGLHLSTEVPICAGSETLCDSFRDKKDWCYFNGRSQSSDFFFFFQSGKKKTHFRWICSRQSNLTFLKGNRLSVRQVFFSVLQSGSLKIITHDWKSCSCVLNFPFFFNSSPPPQFLMLSSQMLGIAILLETRKVFKWFSCFLEQLKFGWSLLVGILGLLLFLFFLFTVMKNRFAVLGEGSRMRKVRLGREDEFILPLSLFQPPKLNSMLFYWGQLVLIISREHYLLSVCFRQCQILQLLLYSPL